MKIGIFRNENGGCDYYRATLPIRTACYHGQDKSCELWVNNIYHEVVNQTEKFKTMMESDIFIFQRLGGVDLIKKMREFIKDNNLKAKIVVDHDDDIFNVSPLSAHYADSGVEEIKIVHNGKLIHEWKDGFNIDIKKNKFRLDQIKKTVEGADMVTVTNENLAKVFRQYNGNVKILPNFVDVSEWNRPNILRENPNEIRIGWGGGQSHWEDLLIIRDVLKDVARRNRNVKIVMIGWKPLTMENDFRPGQFEYHDWVDMAAHPYRMALLDLDIGVIPIKDNKFNRCKSSIKWVEYSSLKIPSVCSYLEPYKEVADMETGADYGVFVENNDVRAWTEGLNKLINNKILRQQIGLNARRLVEDHFDINKKFHLWTDAYKELINGNPIKSPA